MKYIPVTITFILLAHFSSVSQGVADYSVQVSAQVQESPPKITFNWPIDLNATGYVIYRKKKSETSWGIPYETLNGGFTQFVDTNIHLGEAHEYRFVKNTPGYTGYGYIYAGIKVPPTENRGTIILMIDSNYAASLSAEISQLKWDLIGDGWQIKKHVIGRGDSVPDVKELIKTDYYADSAVRTALLLGHIPVPYSGKINPDGHGNHVGAWPADVYYGDMDGIWSDVSINEVSASRVQNHNVPGDGKFDQSYIPSDVEIEIGRIDLFNMPAFVLSDTLLVKRYLNKNHDFRHKKITAVRRGLVDDNFGAYGASTDPFASNGWRNFAPMFGDTNIHEVDYFTTLANQSYLWSFGCGGGSYTSCGGIGNTNQFAADTVQSVFNILFGSYFGDWDSQNNFLRAPLASETHALINFWGGRPHWILHHMALGEHIGYSTRLTQNNSAFYVSNYGGRKIHVALMGDPTLKMHIVAPPSALTADSIYFDEAERVSLSWTASTDSIEGYYLYRSANPGGPYSRICQDIILGSAFIDSFPVNGTSYYMLKAIALETTGSGTYYNLSQGIFDSLTITVSPISFVHTDTPDIYYLKLYPNPSDGNFTLIFNSNHLQKSVVELFDITGRKVFEQNLGIRTGSISVTIQKENLDKGVYICKVNAGGRLFYKRIAIQ